jgi:transposase-like protein
VQDILFCCVDGLEGFPEGTWQAFPRTTVQVCIVHQIRSSMRRMEGPQDGRCQASGRSTRPQRACGHSALQAFAERRHERYAAVSKSWLEQWEQITPFLAYPDEVRRVIYTTNSIEALHRQIRKIVKTRGSFPTEGTARKLIYLAIQNAEARWSASCWQSALVALKIRFGDSPTDTQPCKITVTA